MAVGGIRNGKFTRNKSQGNQAINGLIGGTTYHYVRIKADGPMQVGNSAMDPDGSDTARGYRMEAGEVLEVENVGATAGILDGSLIHVCGVDPNKPASFHIFAIDNI